jgi:dTDP-4-dehydrorhamnose reductase
MKDKKNILVLGSTGMLGSEVLKVFTEFKKFNISSSIRSMQDIKYFKLKKFQKIKFFKFNVLEDNVQKLKKFIKKDTIIINCIGITKPNIDENNLKSVLNAVLINGVFPNKLCDEFGKKNKIYQIATDCVYAGSKKLYSENAPHDALDVYGKTKSLGEVKNKNFFNIRSSIIGKEIKHHKSFYDWFQNQDENSKVSGFTNHFWNGITTSAFGKILISIIENNINIPNKMHICPKNFITKYKMLRLFKDKNMNKKIFIKPIKAKIRINRTLSTKFKKINDLIWKGSIYRKVPTIENLIREI